jgi:multidrug efflux pump subunit AcrB
MNPRLFLVWLLCLFVVLVASAGRCTVLPVEADERPMRDQTGPLVLLEAVYPGASAQVVADSVAGPIERQIKGLEKLVSLRSRCTNDGKYTLAVTFERGADPKVSRSLVHNRVLPALPALPKEVQEIGVNVKLAASGPLMIVNLFSPDGRFDSLYLSNYANIQIKDELARVSGVGKMTQVGQRDYSLRVWLDTDKLDARNLSAAEVVRAIEKHNRLTAPSQAGQAREPKKSEIEVRVQPLTRLEDVERLANLVVKTTDKSREVRLKDVARIEFGASQEETRACLDGKEAVALVIYPTWDARLRKLSVALRERAGELRSRFPEGLDYAIPFDFTANLESPYQKAISEFLLLEPQLPPDASAQRTQVMLRRCEVLLRNQPGIGHVLTLTENPFDLFGFGPCILVELAPARNRKTNRAALIKAVRTQLDEIKELMVRVRDLSGPGFPHCGYPIDLAVQGPKAGRVRDFAVKLAERLAGSMKLTDVAVNPASTPRRKLSVDVDRAKAAAIGVSVEDIFNTLEVYIGPMHVDFRRFGRSWQVNVQAGPGWGDGLKDIGKLKIRNTRGDMVPLGALVVLRETEGPQALDFLDSRPIVEITANLEGGVSSEEVRALCERLAEEIRKELRLPAEYRLVWLQEMSRRGKD